MQKNKMLVSLILAYFSPLSISDPVKAGPEIRNRWKKSYETFPGCGKIPIKPGEDIIGTIFGGDQITEDEPLPWMVSICVDPYLDGNLKYCGGSMITNRKVLTAAHCVEKSSPDNTGLFIGLHNFNVSLANSLEISQIDIYPGYKLTKGKSKLKNAPDIAILTLLNPIQLSDKINTLCLTDGLSHYVNQSAIVSGWGIDETNKISLEKLMSVEVTVLSNVECKKRNRPYYSFINTYVLVVNLSLTKTKSQIRTQGSQ